MNWEELKKSIAKLEKIQEFSKENEGVDVTKAEEKLQENIFEAIKTLTPSLSIDNGKNTEEKSILFQALSNETVKKYLLEKKDKLLQERVGILVHNTFFHLKDLKDAKKVFLSFQIAYELNSVEPVIASNLANRYCGGSGVNKNLSEAIKLYRKHYEKSITENKSTWIDPVITNLKNIILNEKASDSCSAKLLLADIYIKQYEQTPDLTTLQNMVNYFNELEKNYLDPDAIPAESADEFNKNIQKLQNKILSTMQTLAKNPVDDKTKDVFNQALSNKEFNAFFKTQVKEYPLLQLWINWSASQVGKLIKEDNLDGLQMLFSQHPALINYPINEEGNTALILAAKNKSSTAMLQFLIKNGAIIDYIDYTDKTAIQYIGNDKKYQNLSALLTGQKTNTDFLLKANIKLKDEIIAFLNTEYKNESGRKILNTALDELKDGTDQFRPGYLLDLYSTISHVFSYVRSCKDDNDLKKESKEFFLKREKLLCGDGQDYCFAPNSLVNQFCEKIARIMEPSVPPLNTLLHATITEDRDKQWVNIYTNENKLENPYEVFRTPSNHLHLYNGLAEQAIANLELQKTNDIWQGTDAKHGSKTALLTSDEMLAVKQRTPTLKVLVEYTERLSKQSESSKSSIFERLSHLRGKLLLAQTKDHGGTGSELQAGAEGYIAVAEFADWWNQLNDTTKQKIHTIDNNGLGKVLDIILDPGNAAQRGAVRYCIFLKGQDLEKIIAKQAVMKSLNEIDKTIDVRVAPAKLDYWKNQINRELEAKDYSPTFNIPSLFDSLSQSHDFIDFCEKNNFIVDYNVLLQLLPAAKKIDTSFWQTVVNILIERNDMKALLFLTEKLSSQCGKNADIGNIFYTMLSNKSFKDLFKEKSDENLKKMVAVEINAIAQNVFSKDKKTEKKAFEAYQLAAEFGSKVGIWNVAACYHYGKGCSINEVEAVEWYVASYPLWELTKDHDAIIARLKEIHLRSSDLKAIVSASVALDTICATRWNKSKDNVANLKEMLSFLKDIEATLPKLQDDNDKLTIRTSKEKLLLTMSSCLNAMLADKGAVSSIHNELFYEALSNTAFNSVFHEKCDVALKIKIGNHLDDFGTSSRSDVKKSFNAYQLAAELGSDTGMFHLANCYYFGTGCPRNLSEAVKWYEAWNSLTSSKANRDDVVRGRGVLEQIERLTADLPAACYARLVLFNIDMQDWKKTITPGNLASLKSVTDSLKKTLIGLKDKKIKNQLKTTLEKIDVHFNEKIKSIPDKQKNEVAVLLESMGKSYLALGDDKKAFEKIKQSAEMGNLTSKKDLVIWYQNGIGTDKNLLEALRINRELKELFKTGSKEHIEVMKSFEIISDQLSKTVTENEIARKILDLVGNVTPRMKNKNQVDDFFQSKVLDGMKVHQLSAAASHVYAAMALFLNTKYHPVHDDDLKTVQATQETIINYIHLNNSDEFVKSAAFTAYREHVLEMLKAYKAIGNKADDRTQNVTDLIDKIDKLNSGQFQELIKAIDDAEKAGVTADKNDTTRFFERRWNTSRYHKTLEQIKSELKQVYLPNELESKDSHSPAHSAR